MPITSESFSRFKIDAQLKDQGRNALDLNFVGVEHPLPGRTKADYLLRVWKRCAITVIEAKNAGEIVEETR